MSVNSKTFVMLAVDVPIEIYNSMDDDLFYELVESYDSWKPGNISIVFDGMSGGYLRVGYVLAHSDDMYDDFEFELKEEYFDNAYPIEYFVNMKYGYKGKAKLMVFNHIY